MSPSRSWILQANPDRFDIERAIRELDAIHWRLPQHTGEVGRGDIAYIWRSGSDAGIVAVARVVTDPQEQAIPHEEAAFSVHPDEGRSETRVVLKVQPAQFIPKADIASMPEMEDHPIITGPMGTVFPLTHKQATALADRLPQAPERSRADDDLSGLPERFAWGDRGKAVQPLPGGIEAYLDTLEAILHQVQTTQPEETDLEEWIQETMGVAETRSRYTIKFLQRVSLLRPSAARIDLTAYGARWLEERDAEFLAALLHSRIQLFGELLPFLETPRTAEDLLTLANDSYGMGWSTRAQIDRRRAWLGALGAIEQTDEGRLVLTDFGRHLQRVLPIEPPRPEPDPEQTTGEPHGSGPEKRPSTEPVRTPPELEELIEQLELTSHLSNDPDQFEKATAEAFEFLGFESEWLGGAGKTDVLLIAPLSRDDRYRVIVDTKSTRHDAVADQQVDWETLDEHKEQYDADYVALIAPAFRGGRLQERATAKGRRVVLLDVPALVELLKQHEQIPLGLDAYRRLFEAGGGPEDIGERAESERRNMLLAAGITRTVTSLSQEEGSLSSDDLYWNLEISDEHERASRHELETIAQALAQPPFSLISEDEGAYRSVGTALTVASRLRLLADLIAPTREEG